MSTIFGKRCTAIVTSDNAGNVCIGTGKNSDGDNIWQWKFSPAEADEIAKAIIESAGHARNLAVG